MSSNHNSFPAFSKTMYPAPNEHPEFDISRLEWARILLFHLSRGKFYGKITFTFEEGKIQRAEKNESLKP
jgi:hypothetical protein